MLNISVLKIKSILVSPFAKTPGINRKVLQNHNIKYLLYHFSDQRSGSGKENYSIILLDSHLYFCSTDA